MMYGTIEVVNTFLKKHIHFPSVSANMDKSSVTPPAVWQAVIGQHGRHGHHVT